MVGFTSLPTAVGSNIIGEWIKLKDLSNLDCAYCNHSTRIAYLNYCQSAALKTEIIELKSLQLMKWFIYRHLKFQKLSTWLLKWQEVTDDLLSELLADTGSHIKTLRLLPFGQPLSKKRLNINKIIAEYCVNVVELDVVSGGMNDDEIAPVFNSLKHIQYLSVKENLITSKSFYILARNSSNLTSLRMFYLQVCDKALTALAANCPALHTLFINNCRHITGKGVSSLTQTTPYLTVLSLNVPNLTDTDIIAISSHCPQLHTIHIIRAGSVTDTAIQVIVSHCSQLRSVYIDNCSLISSGYCLFRNLHELLISTSTTLTDTMVVAIVANNPFLRHLALMNCSILTSASVLSILHGCSALEKLTVTNTNAVEESVGNRGLLGTLIREHYPNISTANINIV